ncbi:MAG TPA: penicillin-binding transpeptidase domain-containing protein [Pseudonocardiaceae bacterium]|nr:penicillin-binding transpeptidase domain-containing protein [Pseudonocardiaceae bacterium]
MRRQRLVTAVLAVLTVTLTLIASLLSGCGIFGSDPRDAAAAFLDAVARGDAAGAGRLTDNPAAATALIRQIRDDLKPQSVQFTMGDTRTGDQMAMASFSAAWNLGRNRVWRYAGGFDLVPASTAEGWAVRWRPAVLHPRLSVQQRLSLRDIPVDPPAVVDRAGVPLLTWQTVVTVALDRSKTPDLAAVAAPLAAALGQFDPMITEQSIIAGANAAPAGQPSAVAVLRERDYQSVRDRIHDLPGVSFPTQRQLLGPDRGFATQLVPGIRAVVEGQLDDAAGWRIVTVNPMGEEVETLAVQQPHPVPTVTTTVDRAVQTAAEQAVDTVSKAAVIVALQPSTGEILGVAQNGAADAQGPLALTGRYPPGSTFKIVTAVAALEAKQVTVDSPVACPSTTIVGERVVPNDHLFDLGTVPLHTAFAHSCNTTFAQLAARLGPGALTDAADQMGIGMDYGIAGITTVTGQVPPSESMVRRAENGFGQGRVLASPFGMALVASTVAAGGKVPTPVLIRDIPTHVALGPVAPVPREVADALRLMMRETVTRGTAQSLAGEGQLYGKTGTAEANATDAHGWFVGFRGDLAFATLIVGADSSGPALDVSGRFLSALPSP